MILCYHRINPWYEQDAITVNPLRFKKQLYYLKKSNFEFLIMDEYCEKFFSGIKKKVTITFDDGFADNYWFAFEILKKLKVPSVIFLVVDFIGSGLTFQRYKDPEKDRFLNWDEVNEMAKYGVEFGSHTLTHPFLTKLPKEKAEKEISESKKLIEDRIGKEVKYFCYPYGDYNEEVIEIVKKAGYKAGVVNRKRNMKITKYTLPRIGIYSHNNDLIFRIKIWREYLRERL